MNRALLLACAFSLGAVIAVPSANAASDAVVGFGQDVPLSFVVKQIVPAGYTVSYGAGIKPSLKVDWSSGATWESVLRSADAHGKHLAVTVSGSSVVISDADAAYAGPVPASAGYGVPSSAPVETMAPQNAAGLEVLPYTPPPSPVTSVAPTLEAPVAPPPQLARPAPAPVPVAIRPLPPAVRPVQAPVAKPVAMAEAVPAAKPIAVVVPPARLTARQRRHMAAIAEHSEMSLRREEPTMRATPRVVSADGTLWHARHGQTLDEVLGDWADKAGWTLVFSSRMIYELQASADFEGDFVAAASSLVRSVRASPQPVAHFYLGNKTLVISNHSDQTN